MVKKNYKSDFELIYTLLDSEGNEMQVPDNPWELWLSCGNPLGANGRKFIASYDGSAYRNCEVRDNNIIVYADNHHLPTGVLWTTFVDYQPNLSFADGDKTIYTPQPTNVELVSGAGDEPTETDIEILANYVVFEHEYTAGQGITIENDVISATGESYTAGEGITIADGEISVSEGLRGQVADNYLDIVQAQRDITSQGDRITAVEGSITDLTVTDPALQQSDTTTNGTIGKVVKVNEYGNYGQIVSDVVIVNEVLGGQEFTYALPHQEGTISITPDYTLADAADVAAVSQTVQGKADASDVTALANRVTTAEGSIADLTTGNNPALRASDKTTEKTIGKVAEYEDSGDTYLDPTTHQPIPQAKVPLLNTGDLYLDGVFRAGMDNKYALPHEGDEVKLRADYVLADEADVTQLQSDVQSKADTSDVSALDERVVVVETALPTKASTSSVNAIDGRVTTLENTYEDTMNIANNQLHELIDGKAQIAQALTDRGYPTAPTDSSASMAQKITDMAYDAGWLAQLGYDEQNDGGVKDAVAYSKAIKDGWNASETARTFANDNKLVFFPVVDMSQFTTLASRFYNCTGLVSIPKLDIRNVTSLASTFRNCPLLRRIPELDTSRVTSFDEFLYTDVLVERIDCISFKSITAIPNARFVGSGSTSTTLLFMLIKDFGTTSNLTNYSACFANHANWGSGSEENRMSLVNSLLTYSYDRATANYSTCTVKLHADTLARLAQEEIAAITAKGYTLTA